MIIQGYILKFFVQKKSDSRPFLPFIRHGSSFVFLAIDNAKLNKPLSADQQKKKLSLHRNFFGRIFNVVLTEFDKFING